VTRENVFSTLKPTNPDNCKDMSTFSPNELEGQGNFIVNIIYDNLSDIEPVQFKQYIE